ncbi:endonuclease VII domain-containing protein [Streptomyces inhibens]|nr:endonuclease VII domain-containing protein [Streptomyces inhibens]
MQNIAGTKPRPLLSWSGEHWLLPRAYADLLDRWERLEDDLTNQARICSGCRTQGPRWAWRTPTANGYITLCPTCSGAAYQTYRGHLRGVPYESLPRTMRADDYLCRLCGQSRAFTWDHCHDHGYVRGPLCASCNTFEGKGVRFLLREGSVHERSSYWSRAASCSTTRNRGGEGLVPGIHAAFAHGRRETGPKDWNLLRDHVNVQRPVKHQVSAEVRTSARPAAGQPCGGPYPRPTRSRRGPTQGGPPVESRTPVRPLHWPRPLGARRHERVDRTAA